MNFRMEVIGYEDEKRVYRNAFGRGQRQPLGSL